ncbi:hypothetical protein RCL1_006498 [Eukaryota sp. TZLM3-RCL]
MISVEATLEAIFSKLKQRDPVEKEFHQTVTRVFSSTTSVLTQYPQFLPVLERLLEPEGQIIFRVLWVDKEGTEQVNRGFRVEYNSDLGPFIGGNSK